jgi:hypothetical protein
MLFIYNLNDIIYHQHQQQFLSTTMTYLNPNDVAFKSSIWIKLMLLYIYKWLLY